MKLAVTLLWLPHLLPCSQGWIANYAPSTCQPFLRRAQGTRAAAPNDKLPHTTETTTQYRSLFPQTEVISNGTISVDSIHTLYYEEYGNSSSPLHALFLHGGPGAGCSPTHARFFDPSKYHIVLLDQRGSGRSTPRGQVRNNTLLQLIDDCERLRKHVGVERWTVVLGGSWGSTLAIGYAQSYPNSVGSIVLRGVCLLRSEEIDWLLSATGGAASRYPEAWKSFSDYLVNITGSFQRHDGYRSVLHGYYDVLLGHNQTARLAAARSWMIYEYRVGTSFRNETGNLSQAVLCCHPNEGWSFQEPSGNTLNEGDSRIGELGSILEALGDLRKDIGADPESEYQLDMRPITLPLDEVDPNAPSMAMLTCFYSVNDKYCMNHIRLLDSDRMSRIQHIPCIAVQGKMDFICPPDTALDLLGAWPNMELRLPLSGGHSMYDPAITHELVQATDRMAEMFTTT